MKHLVRNIPLTLFAFASVVLIWPQASSAQVTELTPPQEVVLDILECSDKAKSNATLSWKEQTGATEYRVYTRLGEDEFNNFESTTSAKIKIGLDSHTTSIVAVSSVEKTLDATNKTITRESKKSPEFDVDVKKLCEKISPTVTMSPISLKNQTAEAATATPTSSLQPTIKDVEEEEISPTATITSKPVEDKTIAQLDKKYENTQKTQAKIERKVQSVLNWFKEKLFFFD